MNGILVTAGVAAIVLVIFLIIMNNETNKQQSLEEKVGRLVDQKDNLARIILFMLDTLPNEEHIEGAERKKALHTIKREIFDLASDVVVRYSKDEELEKEISRICNKINAFEKTSDFSKAFGAEAISISN